MIYPFTAHAVALMPPARRKEVSRWQLIAGLPVSKEIDGLGNVLASGPRLAAMVHAFRYGCEA